MCKLKLFFGVLLWISSLYSIAQVTFIIDELPASTPAEDQIYIAGTFNGWNPGDPESVLTLNTNEQWEITLSADTQGVTIEFKFTRGDWGTVEKGASGEEIVNRLFTYGNGDTVWVSVLNWADIPGGSTAAENVMVIDDAFYMPQLDKFRRILMYFPPDYQENVDKDYPVLYMHDGQNVFDVYTSFFGEWEVDETLNELFQEGLAVPIVVAIDHGGVDRIDELTPWVNSTYGGGQAEAYMDFIVETLKPHIDSNYRTLTDPLNTGLMGSSLGGLCSFYGVTAHQDVFGKAGVFSPSYWFSDTVWTFLQNTPITQPIRYYQMTGELEGTGMVSMTNLMNDALIEAGVDEENVSTHIISGGQHNEALWSSQFESAYLWLFADYISNVDENTNTNPVSVFPNPTNGYVYIESNESILSFTVFDLMGMKVLEGQSPGFQKLDLSALESGVYILRMETKNDVISVKLRKQ